MRILSLLLFGFSGLITNAQKQVIINGNISGLKEESKVWVISNPPIIWKDSTIVKNGQFHFVTIIPEASGYSIRLSRQFEVGKWQDFYLDKGLLNIKGLNGDFKNITSSGSQYAVDYNSYLKWLAQHGIAAKLSNNSLQRAKAERENDTLSGQKLFKEHLAINSQKATIAREWVKKHPASPISAYVLYEDIGSKISLEDLEAMLDALLPEAKQNLPAEKLQARVDGFKVMAIGKTAPDFTQADTAGNLVSLHDFKGKYLLVDFWASWCLPCRAENPNVVATFEKYKNKSFAILSVSLDKDKENWLKAIQKDNLTWTHVSDLKFWDNAIAKMYKIQSVPFNLLLDPNGKIMAKNLRGDKLNQTIAGYLQ